MHLKGEHPQAYEESDVELPTVDEVLSREQYANARECVALTEGRGSRFLVPATDYPDVGSEYGNGFIHRRGKAYQLMGGTADVIAFGRRRTKRIHECDDVRMLSGDGYELLGLLSLRDYVSVSVHILSPTMRNFLHAARHRSRFDHARHFRPAALPGNVALGRAADPRATRAGGNRPAGGTASRAVERERLLW